MTAITEKITSALHPLAAFDDPVGNSLVRFILLEFGELCKLIRNDLLGLQ